MCTKRTSADELTIAYIGMGVQRYMATDEFQKRTTRGPGGELEFVQAVIDHALMLDALADQSEDKFTGVFVYEVAGEFGYRMAQALATEGEITQECAKQVADELIAANCL